MAIGGLSARDRRYLANALNRTMVSGTARPANRLIGTLRYRQVEQFTRIQVLSEINQLPVLAQGTCKQQIL